MKLLAALAVFMVILALKTAFDEKKKKRELKKHFREDFGRILPKVLSENESRIARRFYENVDVSRGVDDITWNDLGMDALFNRMNTTLTSYGSEALYDMLRTPIADTEMLAQRDSLIRILKDSDEDRSAVMMALSGIGAEETMALTDCIKELRALVIEHDVKKLMRLDILCLILGILATVLIFISPMAGFFTFFGVLFFNLYAYFGRKKKIASHIGCFSVILRLIYGVRSLKDFKGSGGENALLEGYIDSLSSRAESLAPLTKWAFLLTSGRGATGNLTDVVLDYFRMFLHLDILRFYSMLEFAVKNREMLVGLAYDTGMLDAYTAVAAYRRSLELSEKSWCSPDLASPGYSVRGLRHPLIEDCVPNDIEAHRSVLLTGSNASGKSTFLRSVSIAAIMAQTIYTVTADSYVSRPVKVITSMALKDDLAAGDSYYMTEIKSIKRIMEYAGADDNTKLPVLCAIDEVLRGTNTAERIAAGAEILSELAGKALCFAATHDLELAHILEDGYDNYHFTEDVDETGEGITFSYRLMPGSAKSRNAIKLLSLMGYDKAITDRALKRCEDFLETGSWV